MTRISKLDRQLQLQREEAGEHLYANRVRVYPKATHGRVRTIKWAVLAFCLSVYYLLPWLRWDRGAGQPDQALLLSIPARRFYFFNVELWPQDIYFLTGLLVMGAVTLFLVTSLFGRLWCGFTCPQTVWTDLFMLVERWIEGDRNERMRRDAGPANADFIWRKTLKHAVWLGIAFWTGGAWIMYYVDAPTATVEFWTLQASLEVYFFTLLFTATTYLLAGWAREQVCTYMCPWPRFQSAMLDEQTYVVTYEGWRGEPRGKPHRHDAPSGMPALGDCVDCGACVTACPTGIDIRDGIQLECISCGLCVDACNHVMEKLDRPKWLIRWDTLTRQAARARGELVPLRLLRPRTIIYCSLLLIVATVMLVAFLSRATIQLSVQHDRAPLFVPLADGSVHNGYLLRAINKTTQKADFELTVQGVPGATMTLGEDRVATGTALRLPVEADSVGSFRIFVTAPGEAANAASQPLEFALRDPATGEATDYRSVFMGPADRAAAKTSEMPK